MPIVTFQTQEFLDLAQRFNAAADQLPYIVAGLLNNAAFEAKRVLSEATWPQHVVQRRSGFPAVAFRVEKASKQKLTVAVTDVLGVAHLSLHAKGGTKHARGRNIAIPLRSWVRRGPGGVPQRDRPRALIDRTPKRALRITPRGIFVGEGGRLNLRYSFRNTVPIKGTVPFLDDFKTVMSNSIRTNFQGKVAQAMGTRR
jgi:hypothetical protein